ncbi:polyribonucleotide 5'-hydroxyl-kinase [Angomonas deanei]|uniref:Uncharacterized protein n=1 Tax=Angomonas deanei TaxID=59799 RepID=A0A7G2C2E4_9TRYP|nr:polyribonucleotide 5'-hydroxyl-kinase [Angomonas deanei]CAD2212903.1 hypothetical protein, conserved [Angomonas deanei]|eukprot:EPY26091.1 polyribonucleotide 5'-hydroxyl-kinase [Angomonas deanei]
MLDPNTVYYAPLKSDVRSLMVYTLEGGSFKVNSEQQVTVVRHAAGAATVSQYVSRTIIPSKQNSKIVVLGNAQSGKTVTAHTVFNLLKQHNAIDVIPPQVTLLDLNAETNSLYTPGCVTGLLSSSVINPSLDTLRLGETNRPSLLTVNFFTGGARRPTVENAGYYLQCCLQLAETMDSFAVELHPSSEGRRYTIVDVPTPEEGLKEDAFYKRIIEALRPNHVFLVTSTVAEQETGSWGTYLQEDIQRTLPECNFILVPPLSPHAHHAARAALQQEYFIGNALQPLGLSKVVLPFSHPSLQFCSVSTSDNGSVEKRQPDPSWKGLLCFVSHATVMDEVPFAPVAGQLLVVEVDDKNQELVLIIPAPEGSPLECRIIVVPSAEEAANMRVSDVQVASLEEALCV